MLFTLHTSNKQTVSPLSLSPLSRKTSAHFVNMEVRNSLTSVFIDAFTQNTYILVVLSDPSIRTAVPFFSGVVFRCSHTLLLLSLARTEATVTLANIKKAMPRFEKYLSSDQ